MFLKARKSLLTAIVIAALTGWWLLAPTAVIAETVLKTGGTGSGLGLLQLLAEAYKKKHPDVRLIIAPSLGSSGGIKALLQGELDFTISGRPLKEEEKSQGAQAVEFCRSPFVFITNAKVAVRGITTPELEKIYSGNMAAWPNGTRIRLVLRPESETDTKIVKGLSPAMGQAVRSALSREGMIMAITDQDSADAVEKIGGALGGGTLAQILTEKRRVNILSFNGVKPGVRGIGDGSYPLVKSLYLITTRKTPVEAQKFIEFIRSKEGRKIMGKYGALRSSKNGSLRR